MCVLLALTRLYCFNTQPRGGGCLILLNKQEIKKCFNTQPRGGGCLFVKSCKFKIFGFNTQPRGGGCHGKSGAKNRRKRFQHTAARRRLHGAVIKYNQAAGVSTHSRAEAAASTRNSFRAAEIVSTHSRAEAAASDVDLSRNTGNCFNTQPRGGGCSLPKKARKISVLNTVFR